MPTPEPFTDLETIARSAPAMPATRKKLGELAQHLFRDRYLGVAGALARYALGQCQSFDEAFGVAPPAKSPGQKLTEQRKNQVRQIVRLRERSVTWKEIANQLDMDAGSARRLLRNHGERVLVEDVQKMLIAEFEIPGAD